MPTGSSSRSSAISRSWPTRPPPPPSRPERSAHVCADVSERPADREFDGFGQRSLGLAAGKGPSASIARWP
jgi:hypothetical protein